MINNPLECWLNLRMGRPLDSGAVSPEDLREWQFELLRKTIKHAAKSSQFYSKHLSGIIPENIRTPADLSALPFTLPSDLRKNPNSFLCVSQDEVARAITISSSGSSGPPKRLFFTAGDLERTIEFFHYGMGPLVGKGETVLALLPDSRPGGVGNLFSESISRLGAKTVYPEDPSDIPALLNLLLNSRATCILGPAIHIHALSRLWKSKRLPKNQVRSALLCWDVLPSVTIQTISNTFGCEIFSHWGMTETCLGGAVECFQGSGMHLREPDFYVEIVDPATGLPVPDGTSGEILFTTLSRRAMPLIRYKTGDIGQIISGPCTCSLPMRRLTGVTGRLNGDIRLPTSEQLSLSELNEIILQFVGVLDFKVSFQQHPPSLNITLDISPEAKIPSDLSKSIISYPKLNRAIVENDLKINIEIDNHNGNISSGFGKRLITSA
ncbi:Phenylacetate-coenzyme A ligase PaaK, adenylate-forming domain family [Maridesulfovibrio ferrireducens]|uniref:Phenylacetate-coenzyme A ligase PaaK, adenylate-forming domain family n=1 Tax=Maridesulfovibrio ferrireducens TaxID=246191 RepID=A0A1G9BCY7_9BACT|nr:AMP-binding protein [Maridesulfovibrio ferrireducens]SDK37351.1 Phenylacetate-coenzyme A ligase PaaK, adenylate-forming domain family [Maridesulfovibrio ferrireducens]